MSKEYRYYPRQTLPLSDKIPPIYVAVDDVGTCTTHVDKGAAFERLDGLLEEYHESIAFESDQHHEALDRRFKANVFVREL